jgi:hypothetical protein
MKNRIGREVIVDTGFFMAMMDSGSRVCPRAFPETS